MGIFVITGPSAVGKTTVTESLISSNKDVAKVVTHTTRQPRQREVDGEHYKFISREKFEEKIKNNEMLEHAEVYGNLYGSTRQDVSKLLSSGRHVIFPIDIKGAFTIKKEFPGSIVIFLKPLSLRQLRQRMLERGDSLQEVETRLKESKKELAKSKSFDYKVKNDVLSETISKVEKIIKSSNAKL